MPDLYLRCAAKCADCVNCSVFVYENDPSPQKRVQSNKEVRNKYFSTASSLVTFLKVRPLLIAPLLETVTVDQKSAPAISIDRPSDLKSSQLCSVPSGDVRDQLVDALCLSLDACRLAPGYL